MIGPALITDMYTTDLADGSVVKAIPVANISVTPGDSGLSFAVNAYAAGSYKELIIAFQVSAPALNAASVSVYGSPIESGTAQVVEHICEGAPFNAPAFHGAVAWDGCDQNGGTPLIFSAVLRNSSQEPSPTVAATSIVLNSATFIGVANDISLGDIAAAASLSSFTNHFSVESTPIPEPRTAFLSLAGLFAAGCFAYRTKRAVSSAMRDSAGEVGR